MLILPKLSTAILTMFGLKLDGGKPFLLAPLPHHSHVRRRRIKLELELGTFARKIVEGNRRDNRDPQTEHGGDEPLADPAGDLPGRALDRGAAERQERAEN